MCGFGHIDSFRVGPYASYFNDDFFVDAALSVGYHLNETERDIKSLKKKSTSTPYFSAELVNENC